MEGGPGRNEDREMCGESIRGKEARRLNGKMNDWRLPCLHCPFLSSPFSSHFVTKKFTKSLKREREKETEETEDPVKSMRERIHAVRDAQ